MKNKYSLFFILIFALIIKGLYCISSKDLPFFEPTLLDPRYYHDWALRLIKYDWDKSVFYGLPLYPYFVATVYALTGASIAAVKWAQIALGLVTLFFIYKTGEKIGGPRAGVVSGLIGCVYGPLFFHEQIFIPEALGMPLYAATFYGACLLWERVSARSALFFGLFAGLAVLTKAGLLLFVPVYLVVLFIRHSRLSGRGYIFWGLLAFILVILPVPAHNYFRGHDSVFFTSHAGFNFYIGNNPDAGGVFKAPQGIGPNVEAQIEDSKAIAERASGRSLKPSEVSKYWSDKAWGFIRENPGRFFWLCGRKLLLFFDAREISDVDDYQFGARMNDFLKAPWLNFYWLGPLVFAGIFSVARSRYAVPVWLWIGTYLIGMATFFVNARYRLPLLPLFISLAAMAVVDIWDSLKQFKMVRCALLSFFALTGFMIGGLGFVQTDFTRDYVNAGDALAERKDFDAAEAYYLKALKINPEYAKANLAMGLLMTRQGLYDRAKTYYEKSILADPENSQAHNNLGLWHDRAGNLAEAEKYFLRALELKPKSSQARNNLGMIYGKRGEFARAAEQFEDSLIINPHSPRVLTNLGLVYDRMDRGLEARGLLKKALEIDPGFTEARKALSVLENH